MAKNEREIFEPYLKQKWAEAGAVTYQEKLDVIEQLVEETKNGIVPIAGGQRINLDTNNPVVRAIRDGKRVSVDGKKVKTAGGGMQSKTLSLVGAAICFLLPLGVFGYWWFFTGDEAVEEVAEVVEVEADIEPTATMTPEPTPTVDEPVVEFTPVPTITPTQMPTFTPVPVEVNEYEVKVSDERSVADFHNPIAINVAGREMRIATAKYGADWVPEGVEWWPGTDIRKVIAIPYEQSLLDGIFADFEQVITVRLRNGAAIQYQVSDIRRINTFEIENMLSSVPSVALILHGEEAEERWLIEGEALQEAIQIEAIQYLEEIAFLQIIGCTQNGLAVACEIEFGEEHQAKLEELTLTDLEWWEGGSYPKSEIKSLICSGGMCHAVLAGVARTEGTAVIAHEVGGEATVQILPSTN